MKLSVALVLAIVFGSIYTIFRKYQNVAELDSPEKQFNQPLIQTFIIFLGMCIIYFFRPYIEKDKPSQHKKAQTAYLYLLPSIFDVMGTICDTAGLFYTSVSVSQMLKGSVLLFTFLIGLIRGNKLQPKQYWCMGVILGSLFVIGYSNIHHQNNRYESDPLLGNTLIIFSQFLFALMFISEEYITRHYNMQVSNAILWEGIWGACLSATAIALFSVLDAQFITCHVHETISLLSHNWNLALGVAITALSIAPFNYFGLYITQQTSALDRCIICTSRMVVVWAASLCCSWQAFSILQFLGYVLLTIGIYYFNKLAAVKNTEQGSNTEQGQFSEQEQSQKILG